MMHYYQFNIGDYQSHTSHLSEIEDLAFRRMLDWCYLHEKPLPSDFDEIARQIRMRSHSDSIALVLHEFFILDEHGWFSERVLQELAKVGEKSKKASESAKKRWKTHANALPTHSESNATQDTIHITQDTEHKKEKNKRGSRLAHDWVLTKSLGEWAQKERPDLDVRLVAEQFKDYWIAQAGQKGVKLDWSATWRNWVRNTKASKPNVVDIARVTVPMSKTPDPALEKIKADEKITRPPTQAEREMLASLKRKS